MGGLTDSNKTILLIGRTSTVVLVLTLTDLINPSLPLVTAITSANGQRFLKVPPNHLLP